MRTIIGIAALIFVGMLTWQIGARLSTDAVGMGVGLVFGVLAGIPTALLVLATDRRPSVDDDNVDVWRDGYRRGLATGKLMAPFQDNAGYESLEDRERRFNVARPFEIEVSK